MTATGEGPEEGPEEVFRRVAPQLWRVLYGVTGGRDVIAEEALAEAFARALARWDAIREPKPWIFRTAIRLAVEELRKERRSNWKSETTETGSSDSIDAYRDLLAALGSLSKNQRTAVILRFEEGLSVREVARLMGSSPSTVRVHIHRGRKKLRQLLRGDEVSDG